MKLVIMRRRINRFLAVSFLLCLLVGMAFSYKAVRITDPTIWYFDVSDDNSVDINSPNGKEIIRLESKRKYNSYDEYINKCDFGKLIDRGIKSLGFVYRDIQLCNSLNLDEDKLQVRNIYFREKVDKLWFEYYMKYVEMIIYGFLWAVLLWFVILVSTFLFRWVQRGE